MMQSFPPTVVWRHRRENLRKCSLRGLESRPDFQFYTYPTSLILERAVQGAKVRQDFELEPFAMGADHSQMVKAAPTANGYASKDCINLSPSTAVFRLIPDLCNYIVLTIDAPPLSQEDAERGLFILDATWRYAEKMSQSINAFGSVVYRSIPSHYRTAYPRRQTDCFDPERGLASVEAIYIAYQILGRETSGLLINYYWKDLFLQKNFNTQ